MTKKTKPANGEYELHNQVLAITVTSAKYLGVYISAANSMKQSCRHHIKESLSISERHQEELFQATSVSIVDVGDMLAGVGLIRLG